jgi:hypothetical protein
MCYPPVTKDPKEMPSLQDCQTMSLENVQGVYPLSLGRNILTRVHDVKLSRKLATLEFRVPKCRGALVSVKHIRPHLVLRVNQSNKLHKVCINGSRVLVDEVDVKHNDEIALHGEKYRYRVIIIQEVAMNRNGNTSVAIPIELRSDGTNTLQTASSERNSNPSTDIASQQTQASLGLSPATSSSIREDAHHHHDHSQETLQESLPSSQQVHVMEENNLKREEDDMDESSALDKIQTTARQHILDDVSCTICMEILVNTHVANPCGHVFCKSCIDRIPSVKHKRYMTKSCPSCRKEITSLSWARSYDNIIWNMVLMGEIFGGDVYGEEDLNQFLIRSGKNLNDLSEDQKACIFQRCRQGKKKRKFDSFVYSGPTVDVDSDGSVVIADTPPRQIRTSHGMNFGRGLPMFYGTTAENNFLLRQRFLQGFDAARVTDGRAGTVEDPICLDD